MKVAVLDIGKTNAKLALVETAAMAEIAVETRPNRVLPGPPYPHMDTDGLWEFFLGALSRMQAAHGIEAISVTTHGACFALLDAAGALACPVLDYEQDVTLPGYDALRPAFAESGSPRLPLGLNAGAQLFWLLETQPGLRTRVAQVVSYPQYWSGRLTGHFGCEVTSLGCHTDLWLPHQARFSALPDRLGLTMAPLIAADTCAPLLPEIATRIGLPAGKFAALPVASGLHDSNASLLPHLRAMEGAFTVVSTGTWVVSMAIGAKSTPLDPGRDTLVNVNALGGPTPSARFMGGREYERLAPETTTPTPQDIHTVLKKGFALLPSIEPGCGPFPDRRGGWSDAAMTPGQKGAALAFYLALMTAECQSLIGAQGPLVVEGPFARNLPFLDMLATVTGRPVLTTGSATGTSIGAALLADPSARPKPGSAHPVPDNPMLKTYAADWQGRVTLSPAAAP